MDRCTDEQIDRWGTGWLEEGRDEKGGGVRKLSDLLRMDI